MYIFQVWSLLIGYIVAVMFFWTEKSRPILKPLAVPVWGAVLLHLASIAGPLRVPIMLALIILMIIGFVTEVKKQNNGMT